MKIFVWAGRLLCVAGVVASMASARCGARDQTAANYREAMRELGRAKSDYDRWCTLGDAAKWSVFTGKDAEARRYAEELERVAPKYRGDWNHGNAVHDYNEVLGLLALESGDVAGARRRLLAAGRTEGSPQLDSYGPNLELARRLLLKGEGDAVVEYLELCRNFWAPHPGTSALDRATAKKISQWQREIRGGSVPDFGANLVY